MRQQRGFAEQAARFGDEFTLGGAFRGELKRAALDDVSAVAGFAGGEQYLAGFYRIGFRADGEDAQRGCAEATKNRHLA